MLIPYLVVSVVFGGFKPILGHLGLFRTILGYFGPFEHFLPCFSILIHFPTFLTIFDQCNAIDTFWSNDPFYPMLKKLIYGKKVAIYKKS